MSKPFDFEKLISQISPELIAKLNESSELDPELNPELNPELRKYFLGQDLVTRLCKTIEETSPELDAATILVGVTGVLGTYIAIQCNSVEQLPQLLHYFMKILTSSAFLVIQGKGEPHQSS